MSKSISFESLKPYFFLVFCVCLVVFVSSDVFASSAGGDGMPWEGPLEKIKDSITGPVATGLSVLGIVGAGAALVFGGDMNGFLRGIIILVLVVALIVSANNVLTSMFGVSAVVSVTDVVDYYRC